LEAILLNDIEKREFNSRGSPLTFIMRAAPHKTRKIAESSQKGLSRNAQRKLVPKNYRSVLQIVKFSKSYSTSLSSLSFVTMSVWCFLSLSIKKPIRVDSL